MATEFYPQPARTACIGLIVVAVAFGAVPAIALWIIYAITVAVQGRCRR